MPTENNIQTEGTFAKGKMYRANGRWAKVMVTKMVTRPSLISVAFGYQGDLKAIRSYSYDLKPGYQKSLDHSARTFVLEGVIDV